MKLKLLAFVAAAAMCIPAASHAGGWGEEQTKGTLRGALWGSVIGGVTGHQSGKRDEGILLGAVLGSIIGNKSGQGKDERRYQDRRYDRYNQSRDLLYRRPGGSPSYSTARTTDPAVLEAQQRAEAVEKELQRERERIRAAQEREAALIRAQEREMKAREELEALRNR